MWYGRSEIRLDPIGDTVQEKAIPPFDPPGFSCVVGSAPAHLKAVFPVVTLSCGVSLRDAIDTPDAPKLPLAASRLDPWCIILIVL